MTKRRHAEARALALPQHRPKVRKDKRKRKPKHKGRNLARALSGDGRRCNAAA